ncbi:MAG: nucleotide exchange factor GrpE [Myxococcota bacterium]|nr:nucleotide exchange factor GrpE [Myxococcota bacterium]
MSNDEKPTPDKPLEDEAPGGWQALAEEEPTAGTLAPSDELEAALAEASDAIESRQAVADSADAARGSAESVILEALSTELQTLKAEYEAGCEELEQLKDSNLRLQAEFDNFRRRGLKEKQEAQLYGHQNLVKELLPTVDNLDRAVEHAEQNNSEELQNLLQGVELVRRELLAVLEKFGVAEVETEGCVFDPAVHEALAQAASEDVEPNHVLSVMEKGYQLRDRMLRPARVVVSKAPDEAPPEPGDGEPDAT